MPYASTSRRRARAAVAALVGREHVVAGVGERRDLVAPRVGALGEAVAQHDRRRRRVAGLDDVELDAVDGVAVRGRHGADVTASCRAASPAIASCYRALTRQAASAAPSSVAGGAPMRYSSSIARHGPVHVELAEDRARRPTRRGRG